MALEVEILPDADAVARRGAEIVAERAAAAVADHGSFTFAVSSRARMPSNAPAALTVTWRAPSTLSTT